MTKVLCDDPPQRQTPEALAMRITNSVLAALKRSDFSSSCPGAMELLEHSYKTVIGQSVLSVVKEIKL